jgi:1-phosphatidylinositol-4-phosphate 5-kinase
VRRKTTQLKGSSSPGAIAMRRAMRGSDPKRMGTAIKLPETDVGDERQHFLFYQDEGGLRATDESNETMDTIYYLGVIDICTPYTTFKRIEHLWKGMKADRVSIFDFFVMLLMLIDCSIKLARWNLWNMVTGSSAS